MACEAARERVLMVPPSLALDGGSSQETLSLSGSQGNIPQSDINQQILEVSSFYLLRCSIGNSIYHRNMPGCLSSDCDCTCVIMYIKADCPAYQKSPPQFTNNDAAVDSEI